MFTNAIFTLLKFYYNILYIFIYYTFKLLHSTITFNSHGLVSG